MSKPLANFNIVYQEEAKKESKVCKDEQSELSQLTKLVSTTKARIGRAPSIPEAASVHLHRSRTPCGMASTYALTSSRSPGSKEAEEIQPSCSWPATSWGVTSTVENPVYENIWTDIVNEFQNSIPRIEAVYNHCFIEKHNKLKVALSPQPSLLAGNLTVENQSRLYEAWESCDGLVREHIRDLPKWTTRKIELESFQGPSSIPRIFHKRFMYSRPRSRYPCLETVSKIMRQPLHIISSLRRMLSDTLQIIVGSPYVLNSYSLCTKHQERSQVYHSSFRPRFLSTRFLPIRTLRIIITRCTFTRNTLQGMTKIGFVLFTA
nr:hypothetical protein Iba_chr11eCG12900 [Ipomoea batatas]